MKTRIPRSKMHEIDPNSPLPPSTDQMTAWMRWVRIEHRTAAKARGLEGEVATVIGMINGDPNKGPKNEGLPRKVGSELHRGTAVRGDGVDHPSDPRGWTVQGNDLVELWGGRLFANVITLVRPDPEIPGSALPIIPDGFDCLPLYLQGIKADSIEIPVARDRQLANHLLNLFIDWGDWSAIPSSELFRTMEFESAISDPKRTLLKLAQMGLLRIEDGDGETFKIHALPTFARIFMVHMS